MDLSDGLADAVRQLAAASGVGIAIDAASLPIAEPVRRWHEARGGAPTAAVLQGGDDYELLFTVRPAHQGRLRGARRLLGDLAITRIGVVTRERRVVLRSASGTHELPEGFEHFR
jgi:thiamine-monophosphate kinase